MSIYSKVISGSHKGREIIYVEGKNSDKMIVSHALLGTLTARISPDNVLAKKETRHTIKEAGLPSVVSRMISILECEGNKPGCKLVATYLGEESGAGGKVIRLRIEHSSYAARTDITLDARTFLPASFASWDKDGALIESFKYYNIKTNVGLTDADFDPDNPQYHF